MPYSVNLTELTTKLGDYCRENKSGIISELVLDRRFEERFEVMDGVTDETPLVMMSIGDIVKPAKADTFDPTPDAINFEPRLLKVRGMKVDLKIVPQTFYNKWLGMNKKKGRADTGYLPFEDYIMGEILKKARNNVHMKGIFKGVYNANGTTTADTMDGWLKKILIGIADNEISAGEGNLVNTGVITKAGVIDQLEMVYDALGEDAKDVDTRMFVNPTIFTWLQRAMRAEFGQNVNYGGMTTSRSLILDGTMCEVVSEPGLGTSQRIMCGVKDNFHLGTDSADDANVIEIEKEKRWLNVMMDFAFGVEVGTFKHGMFSTNNQA
jgi:hypothetical protein